MSAIEMVNWITTRIFLNNGEPERKTPLITSILLKEERN